MGLFGSGKRCKTNYVGNVNDPTPPPNPNPNRWEIIDKKEFENGYVLKVHYFDCTNFEGIKIMVYKGKFKKPKSLDPHFCDSEDSPIARFRPDDEGWEMACGIAAAFKSETQEPLYCEKCKCLLPLSIDENCQLPLD